MRHLLIDEFQDTNPQQWNTVRTWLEGYATGEASSDVAVFIVGDPKQSIYGFRGAQAGVFTAARDFIATGLGGHYLRTSHTWRCAPAVTAAINQVFVPLGESFADFEAHTTQSDASGAVLALPLMHRPEKTPAEAAQAWRASLNTPRELEAAELRAREVNQAADWIAQQIAQGTAAQDILVLARRRDRLRELAGPLRERGIAYAQGDGVDLCDACEVQDITALLDVLTSPSHNLSLARALKSPIFGWPDEALSALAGHVRLRAASNDWLDALLTFASPLDTCLSESAPISGDAINGDTGTEHQKSEQTNTDGTGYCSLLFRKTADTLLQWQKSLAVLPPHDALVGIFQTEWPQLQGLTLPQRFAQAAPRAQRDGVLANLFAVLAQSLAQGGGRFLSTYALVRALKRPGVRAASAGSALTFETTGPARGVVQGLTIHKAKGLEAHTVLLLDADTEAPKTETYTVRSLWPAHSDLPLAFVFLASTAKPPAALQALLTVQAAQSQREGLNNLYVAFTRAKNRLVLSATQPHRPHPDGHSAWQLLHAFAQPVDDDVAAVPANQQVPPQLQEIGFWIKNMPPVQHRRSSVAIKNEQLESTENTEIEADSDRLSRIGQAMHSVLQQQAADEPAVLRAVGARFGLSAEELERANSGALKIRNGEGAWGWRAANLRFAADEVELAFGGGLLRIDRLLQLGDGQWWVLDFKLANASQLARHAPQLQQYVSGVTAMLQQQTVSEATPVVRGAILGADGSMWLLPMP